MTTDEKSGIRGRPFVGVTFECCRVYSRVYLNRRRNAFVGWCPRCGAKVELLVSPGGSKEKFFVAR